MKPAAARRGGRAMLGVALVLVLPACAAYQLSSAENEALPGFDASLPAGYTETYRRVRHYALPVQAHLAAETGNVWPGKPDAVPTSLDILQRGGAVPREAPRIHRGGYGMCVARPSGPAPGVALGICYAVVERK